MTSKNFSEVDEGRTLTLGTCFEGLRGCMTSENFSGEEEGQKQRSET